MDVVSTTNSKKHKMRKLIAQLKETKININNQLMEITLKYNNLLGEYNLLRLYLDKTINENKNEINNLKTINQELHIHHTQLLKEQEIDNSGDRIQLNNVNTDLCKQNNILLTENSKLIEENKLVKSEINNLYLELQQYKTFNISNLENISNNMDYHISKILGYQENNTWIPDLLEAKICKNTINYITNYCKYKI